MLSPSVTYEAFFAVALEDFFLAAFFVVFFAAFFAFFFAMIQSLLQEKNLGGTVSTAGWRTGLSVSVSTSRSHESIPACQPWQAVCCLCVLSLSFVIVAAAIIHEHLTFHITHESTRNTSTSYEFQKMFQDNCSRFQHFSSEIFETVARSFVAHHTR
jgi:uncharacterized membrane protein YjfL (UPF0719 family)